MTQLVTWSLLYPVLILSGAAPAPNKEEEAKQTRADAAAFQAFLKANKLDERWQGNPTRLDSEEIRKAYNQRRAYYTYQAPPLPPGAFNPQIQEAFRQRMAEYRRHSLRIAVLIEDDKVTALKKPADFNTGLMPIKTDDDARVAAAAILSLLDANFIPPGRVEAKDVKVTRGDKGWTCTVSKPRGFDGQLIFDAGGKCVAVSKQPNFIQPLPPSAPPRLPANPPPAPPANASE